MAEYIEREAAKKNAFRYLLPNGEESPMVMFVDAIDKIPAADVEPVRHGTWEVYSAKDSLYMCSKCHCLPKYKTKYCPNCGARMDGEERV